MIPDKVLEQIPLYVLGELEPGEAAALEAMMVRSPELREEVRACAEALAAVAAEAAIPTKEVEGTWAKIEQRVRPAAAAATCEPPEVILPESEVVKSAANGHARAWAWAWAAAAAVLLLLNVAQWRQLHPKTSGPPTASTRDAPAGDSQQVNVDPSVMDRAPGGQTARDLDGAARLRDLDLTTATPAEIAAAHRALRQEYERLEREHAALSDNVVPLLLAAIAEQRTQGEDRSGLSTMELRSLTATQPQVSAGLWDRVQELLPQNGLAVMPDRWRLAGGVVLDPAWWTGGNNANAGGNAGARIDKPPPFALAVFNGNEGLGYLDLYNLPTVPAGQEMRLWMQAEGQSGYTAVGTVPPSLVGGSGGLAFRVPSTTAPPNRFLVTIEPAHQTPQPSGVIVIEGP